MRRRRAKRPNESFLNNKTWGVSMSNDNGNNGFGISRRAALQGLGTFVPALMVGSTVGPLPAAAQQTKGPINFMTWGGNFGEGVRIAFSDPFQQETGFEIKDITPFNLGKFQTAIRHGNPEGYDLAWFNDEVDPALVGAQGMLEELDYSKMPNSRNAIPGARQKYGAAPYVTIYPMSFNTKAFGDKSPSGWKDFWDVDAFPGPRSLGTWVCGVLEAALMADGVTPDKLYPLDEDRAFKMLDKIKPHIRVFHDTQANEAVQQMLEQGEIVMVLTWGSDTVLAHLEGKPINVVYNEGFYFSPLVGIAKGSKYVAECTQYLDSFFDPKKQMAFINAWPTSPANPAVLDLMTPEQKAAVATGHFDKMVNFDVAYYSENRARLQQKYDSWRIL